MKRAEHSESRSSLRARIARAIGGDSRQFARILSVLWVVLAISPGTLGAQAPEDGFAHAPEAELGGALAAPEPARLEILLLEPRRDPRIEPIVAGFIDSRLRFGLAEAGWAALSRDEARDLLRSNRLSESAEMSRIRALIVREGIALALLPIVYAADGNYIVELWIVRGDAEGVVAAQVASGATNLGPAVDALLEAKLPRVLEFDRAAASAATLRMIEDERLLAETYERARSPREPTPKRTHWGAISLASGSAIGPELMGSRFYIHTLRARLELRPRDRLGIGIITGYANLPGDNGRAHNIPILGEFSYRVPIAGVRPLSVPVRFALGYLPFNGPIMRTSVGLHLTLEGDWEIGVDLLSPTLLRSPNNLHFAFDIALEITRRFGRVAP